MLLANVKRFNVQTLDPPNVFRIKNMFLIIVSKLILLKEKIQGPLEYSSRSKRTDENVHQKMA